MHDSGPRYNVTARLPYWKMFHCASRFYGYGDTEKEAIEDALKGLKNNLASKRYKKAIEI